MKIKLSSMLAARGGAGVRGWRGRHRPRRRRCASGRSGLRGPRDGDVRDGHGADHGLRGRIGRAAGPLRRARLRGAPHRRGRQAVRDTLRTASADDVERTISVSGRRRQRRRGGAGGRPQHGIVPGHRPPARVRRRHDGCRPSGRDGRVRSRSGRARRPCVRRARTDVHHRPGDPVALLRPRTRSKVLRRLLRRRTAGHDVRRSATPRTSTASPSARPR